MTDTLRTLMEPTSTSPARLPWRRSLLLTAVLGWILPGLGQLYVGRPVKALVFLLAILPTFLVGWALTDFTVVDREHYYLDFWAQILLGGPTVAAHMLAEGRVLDHLPRFFDVGRLYVQVAGLLNLVAISDALGAAITHNRVVELLRLTQDEDLDPEPHQAPESDSATEPPVVPVDARAGEPLAEEPA